MVSPSDSNAVFRQLGEIGATQVGFREDLNELKAAISALTQERRVDGDVMRGQQQILAHRIDSLERQGSMQHAANTQRLDEITRDLGIMKAPVAQLIGFRKHIAKLIIILLSAIGFAWTLAQPVYTLLVGRIFSHS